MINPGDVVFMDYGERPQVVHARLVLDSIDPSTHEYMILTPDHDMYSEVLHDRNGDLHAFYLGGPGGGLPRGVAAANVYGFALMTVREYSNFMRIGRTQAAAERAARGIVPPPVAPPADPAAAPGAGAARAAAAAAGQLWVLGESIGQKKIGDIVDVPAGAPSLGDVALVQMVDSDGQTRVVTAFRVSADEVAQFCEDRVQQLRSCEACEGIDRIVADDIRTLAVKYGANGERHRGFKETVDEMTTTEMSDFPFEPRTCLPYLQAVQSIAESNFAQHLAWVQQSKIPEGSRAVYEDEALAQILDVAICYDCLCVSNLASFELLVRRRQLIADAQ